ncbi:ATP-binding protein [Streptomyces sp. E11-3]|uniref:ATP-binding protein n=1 Tax=Streptomyces sp. E11-3 TaxID=3110112 RepID=UPI00397ECB69
MSEPNPNPNTGGDRYDVATYTPHPKSVPALRRRVAERVTTWGHPEVAGDAALLASELSTNALLHGSLRDRLFRVELFLTRNTLRVAVTDPKGEHPPSPRQPGRDDQFGRGLLIVGTLAARWNVESLAVGKTVWAELDLPSAAARTVDLRTP